MEAFKSLAPDDLAAIREVAQDLFRSKFVPPALDSKEKIQAVVMLGRELGIPTMAAVRGIQIIGGVPVITPALMLALAFRSKELEAYEILTSTDLVAGVYVKRKGFPSRTETFTMEDAERFGFAEQAGWKEEPRAMLRWHAIALALRFDFADLFFGLFLPHEIEGADSDALGTAYAQASEIHAEAPWKPSTAILAARATTAATRPLAVQDDAAREDLAHAPAPARAEASSEEASSAAPPSPCPPGGHVFLGFPRCARCKITREEADAQLPPPLAPFQADARPNLAAVHYEHCSPSSCKYGDADCPVLARPAEVAPKCGFCNDKGTIPINSEDPSQGETDCLACLPSRQAQAAPEVVPAVESQPGGQPAQGAAVTDAPAPAGESLFEMEGVGGLQMDIFYYAGQILPAGANLRTAMDNWILKRYEIAGGLPGLVAFLESQKKDPVAELKTIRDLFQAEYEKRVKAAVAESVDDSGK